MSVSNQTSRDIIQADETPTEKMAETHLRPTEFRQFVGQDKLKKNLEIFLKAAKDRNDVLDHVLFCAPPGLGKTTLANIIAREMGSNLRQTSGPVLEKVGDLAAILTSLADGDVFFIDEIHRLSRTVEEALYPALEDGKLDIIVGQGPSAKTVKLPLPRFTLIGATTRSGLLTSPLRDRFGIVSYLEYYEPQHLVQIISRSATILKTKMDPKAALEISKRSRGTPRIANRILKRVRDFAQVKGGQVSVPVAKEALDALEIDSAGLDRMDRNILLALLDKFSGGPVGLDTLAVAVSEEANTVEDVYEPYLIKAGYLIRTPRGRVLTPLAYEHFGRVAPSSLKKNLPLFTSS